MAHYKILHADDEETFRSLIKQFLTSLGYEVDTVSDGVEAINALQNTNYDLVLLDISMPKVSGIEVLEFMKEKYPATEVIICSGLDDLNKAVECMKKGAYHYITKPILFDELQQNISRALERRDLLQDNAVMRSELERIGGAVELIGKSPPFHEMLTLAEKVAPTDTSVLIQGASGTGKELVATFLHRKSSRCGKPFVAINCASIPDTLIESELFGYEKGAFTDAHTQKLGLVELANRGTLFLDEVGDISQIIQPKLLRFIQTGEFRRVGGNSVFKADVRLISATNKDLREEVKQNRFREDLLYRLNVITIQVPPLRERKEDIPLLVGNFLAERPRNQPQKEMSAEAMEVLTEYDWPGNVRELENVLESALILSQGNVIEPEDLMLPPAIHSKAFSPASVPDFIGQTIPLRETERLHIAAVLNGTKWDKKLAAKLLGISLKTLYTKIAQFNLQQL